MISTCVSNINKTTLAAVVSVVPTAQQKDSCDVNSSCPERTARVQRNVGNSTSQNKNKSASCLDIETAQKMIRRLLIEKKIPKTILAENLGITRKDLEHILLQRNPVVALITKINLSLIKLYCSTNFNNQ